jgi:hypothetical protein
MARLLNQSPKLVQLFEKAQVDYIKNDNQPRPQTRFQEPLTQPLGLPKFVVTRWNSFLLVFFGFLARVVPGF